MNRLPLKSTAERSAAAGGAAIIACCLILPLLVSTASLMVLGPLTEVLVFGVALLPLSIVLWRKRAPHREKVVTLSSAEGATCELPSGGPGASGDEARGILSGGCCADGRGMEMGSRARYARLLAGVAFLLIAGAMASRQLPGEIALWPAALVPTWFGIAHLVAAVTSYRGCPELGAIPSVMLDRQVGTTCLTWERIDRRLESRAGRGTACCG